MLELVQCKFSLVERTNDSKHSSSCPEKKKLNAKSKPFVSTDAAKTAHTEFANQLHRRTENAGIACTRTTERTNESIPGRAEQNVIHFRSVMAIARVNPEEALEVLAKGGFCDKYTHDYDI